MIINGLRKNKNIKYINRLKIKSIKKGLINYHGMKIKRKKFIF